MKIKGKKIVAAAVLAALAVLWPVQAAKAQSIEDALEADSKAVEAQEPGEGEKQEEIPDGADGADLHPAYLYADLRRIRKAERHRPGEREPIRRKPGH